MVVSTNITGVHEGEILMIKSRILSMRLFNVCGDQV